jgi:hypothetical protein
MALKQRCPIHIELLRQNGSAFEKSGQSRSAQNAFRIVNRQHEAPITPHPWAEICDEATAYPGRRSN